MQTARLGAARQGGARAGEFASAAQEGQPVRGTASGQASSQGAKPAAAMPTGEWLPKPDSSWLEEDQASDSSARDGSRVRSQCPSGLRDKDLVAELISQLERARDREHEANGELLEVYKLKEQLQKQKSLMEQEETDEVLLQQSLQPLLDKIQKLEDKENQLNDQIKAYEEEIRRLTDTVDQLNDDLREAKRKEAAEAKRKEEEARAAEAKRKEEEAKVQIKAYKEKIQQLNNDLRDSEAKREEAEAKRKEDAEKMRKLVVLVAMIVVFVVVFFSTRASSSGAKIELAQENLTECFSQSRGGAGLDAKDGKQDEVLELSTIPDVKVVELSKALSAEKEFTQKEAQEALLLQRCHGSLQLFLRKAAMIVAIVVDDLEAQIGTLQDEVVKVKGERDAEKEKVKLGYPLGKDNKNASARIPSAADDSLSMSTTEPTLSAASKNSPVSTTGSPVDDETDEGIALARWIEAHAQAKMKNTAEFGEKPKAEQKIKGKVKFKSVIFSNNDISGVISHDGKYRGVLAPNGPSLRLVNARALRAMSASNTKS